MKLLNCRNVAWQVEWDMILHQFSAIHIMWRELKSSVPPPQDCRVIFYLFELFQFVSTDVIIFVCKITVHIGNSVLRVKRVMWHPACAMICTSQMMKLYSRGCRVSVVVLLNGLFQIINCAVVNVEHYPWDVLIGKSHTGLNLVTKVVAHNLHYEHEDICLRALVFSDVFLKKFNTQVTAWGLMPSCWNQTIPISAS